MSKMELKEFTKTDWYGYAGVERFADGSEPMIAGVDVTDNSGVTVIADRTGVEVNINYDAGDEGDKYFAYSIELGNMSKSLVIEFAKSVVDRINELLDNCNNCYELKGKLESEWEVEFDEV